MKCLQFNKTLLSLTIAAIVLSSCKKVVVPEDTGTKGQKIISIIQYGSLEAAAFSASSLSLDLSQPVITQELYLKYSGPTVFSNDVTVTVAYDDAALTAYNASVPVGGLKFVKLPSNFYSIKTPTVKIPAGTAISEAIKIDIYADKLDPAVSYMFPISITVISGAPSDVVKAKATSTAYLHVIGNPIAGNYTHEWLRWNNSDGSGAPAFDEIYADAFGAVDPNTIEVESGTGVVYIVTFDGMAGGTLSNFQAKFPSSGPGSAAAAGITITAGPTVTLADPANRKFTFTFNYNNSAGSPRVIIDKFTP